jgi:hypothetical protein
VFEETVKQIANGFKAGSDLSAVYVGDELRQRFVGGSHAASEVLADEPWTTSLALPDEDSQSPVVVIDLALVPAMATPPFVPVSAHPAVAIKLPKVAQANKQSAFYLVGRPGLEPGTLGLKVPCSTR